MIQLPVISVAYDADNDEHVLMATSYSQTTPAGARLFRGAPTPDIKFKHADHIKAAEDAATLQAYINEKWQTKKQSKATLRKHEEARA